MKTYFIKNMVKRAEKRAENQYFSCFFPKFSLIFSYAIYFVFFTCGLGYNGRCRFAPYSQFNWNEQEFPYRLLNVSRFSRCLWCTILLFHARSYVKIIKFRRLWRNRLASFAKAIKRKTPLSVGRVALGRWKTIVFQPGSSENKTNFMRVSNTPGTQPKPTVFLPTVRQRLGQIALA